MTDKKISKYSKIIREYILKDYRKMCREPAGQLEYPFIVPGSNQYANVLWDWDAFFSNVALRQILADIGSEKESGDILPYEQGCVLNFLNAGDIYGQIPGAMRPEKKENADDAPEEWMKRNNHKPCLAQHAALIVKGIDGDAEWLREKMQFIHFFMNNYRSHRRNKDTGLYFWVKTGNIGVDNDPCTYYRPYNSDASIYLNCFMMKELEAVIYLCERLNQDEVKLHYQKDLEQLRNAVQEHCWDEWSGFFYSADLALRPVDHESWGHWGMPRDYDCLVNRILVWSGFLALWSGVATKEQAERVVSEHFKCEKTFNAPYGIRTLAKVEKMYNLRPSGNPSSWLGPIWGVSNYMVFHGLVKYGFNEAAAELAEKTVKLFGHDIERTGAMHEYYQPENGEPLLNHGFQNWNMLVMNMISWLETGKMESEL